MSETLKLTTELVNKKTPTPDDNGCQKLIADRLSKIGFTPKHLRFEDVDNLWITHGSSGPLFVFAGHTDTVPVGPSKSGIRTHIKPKLRKESSTVEVPRI